MCCKGRVRVFGEGNVAFSWQARGTADAGVVRDGLSWGYRDLSDCK